MLIALLVFGLVQTACSGPVVEARQARRIPWWVWVLVVLALVALWLWWQPGRSKEKAAPPTEPGTAAPSHVVETPEGVARRAAPVLKAIEPDDLKLIEGIGPKISSLLQAAGIVTFAHLASTDVKRLKQIIAEAGLTALADPTSWPEQAGLAATGQWDALRTLQDELKGGRRV
jgi:predicted flap endonuclease-1-like 5' DNA nuclease